MKTDAGLARLHLRIEGRVQGVYFRAAAKAKAQALGITGFARNLADGSVAIVAEGPRTKLEELHRWAYHGPRDANVAALFVSWGAFQGEFRDFAAR
jgi:acylphosphatase